MTTNRTGKIAIGLLVLSLLLGACSLGDESAAEPYETSGDAADTAPGAAPATDTGGDVAEGFADSDTSSERAIQQPIVDVASNRDLIYTARMWLAVNDVAEATREASSILASLGGVLFGQETTGGVTPETTLVFRVLPEDFGEALDRLGQLGVVREQRVSTDDVTERVVDLESRINTATVSVERLRALLESATDINDIAALENQLLERETSLETLRGQLRTIQDQVDLATITVTITEAVVRPAIALAVSSYPGVADAGLSCPGTPTLEVEQGDSATVCFEITNVGDAPLTDLTLTDPILEIELSDLTLVFGQDEEPLDPGNSLVYFLAFDVDETARLQTRVSAIPLDEAGEPLPGRGVADTATATLLAAEPTGLPGFGDGLEASWDLLVLIAGALVLAAGAIVPFLWVPVVIWLVARWVRGRADRDDESETRASQADEDSREPAGV